MNKNLCFLNFLVDEKTGSRGGLKVPVIDRERMPESLDNGGDYVIDFINDDIESAIIANQGSVENFIVLNKIQRSEVIETAAKQVLVRCFSIIKGLCPVIMQNRGCRFWLVYCPDYEEETSYGNVIQDSLKEGFASLTRVFAMEMAKRRVNINYVTMHNSAAWTKFVKLMEDLRGCSPFNLTAQEIKIEG